jgi:hypothetical protein
MWESVDDKPFFGGWLLEPRNTVPLLVIFVAAIRDNGRRGRFQRYAAFAVQLCEERSSYGHFGGSMGRFWAVH